MIASYFDPYLDRWSFQETPASAPRHSQSLCTPLTNIVNGHHIFCDGDSEQIIALQ